MKETQVTQFVLDNGEVFDSKEAAEERETLLSLVKKMEESDFSYDWNLEEVAQWFMKHFILVPRGDEDA